jgi:hypothetical protein
MGETCTTLQQEDPNNKHVASSTPGDDKIHCSRDCDLPALMMPRAFFIFLSY